MIHTHTADPAQLHHPMTYDGCREWLLALCARYPCFQLQTIGTTAGGRSLYAAAAGAEDSLPAMVCIGGFSASDWLTVGVLLRFLEEYGRLLEEKGRLYRIHLPALYANRRICICPMINGDAFALSPDPAGTVPDCRNGYGTDILRYFAVSVGEKSAECPPVEKCPEAAALRQYLLWQEPALFCTFRTAPAAEETALTVPHQPSPRAESVGRLLARMLSAPLSGKGDPLAVLAGWYGAETGHPSFCTAVADTGGEDRLLAAYAAVREMLFTGALLTG